jgi:hypothetical protein
LFDTLNPLNWTFFSNHNWFAACLLQRVQFLLITTFLTLKTHPSCHHAFCAKSVARGQRVVHWVGLSGQRPSIWQGSQNVTGTTHVGRRHLYNSPSSSLIAGEKVQSRNCLNSKQK